MGPLSTITGATIINAIAIDAAARLRATKAVAVGQRQC